MPHVPQDHVHRLIRSMSRAEKRYFKLHTSRHVVAGHSNPQALFDAIAAMPVYNEKALRETFAEAPFMRRLPIAKRRLYEAVLDSLDAFHAKNSIDDKLRRALHHVEILFDRALYADAAKILRSTRTLARAHDRQAALLQVAEWERRAMERGNYGGITAAELDARADSVAGITDEWQEVDRLWQLKSRSFLLIYRSGQAPGPAELTKLEALAGAPLLADGVQLHTARARFLHHHVRSALAYARNELATCEVELTACAKVLRAEQPYFHEEPDLMLGVMGNLAHVRMRLGRHQEALDGFREFRKIPLMLAAAPSPDLEMKLFVMGTSLELSVLSAKGEFPAAQKRLADLEEGLARYGSRASTVRRAELAMQAAYACFGAGAHDLALRWCNRLLNEKGIESHIELHALGRMMNLAVLVELRKAELLDYVVRNTRRFLKQHDPPFAAEPLLLDHAQALFKAKGTPARYAQWAKLATALSGLASNARAAAVLDHIDLLSWAQSHADDKSFSEVVKAKWMAQNKTARYAGAKRAA